MRLSLLTAGVPLLLLAVIAAATPDAVERSSSPSPFSLSQAQLGLDAANKLISIFTHDIFNETLVGQVASMLSNILSFVGAFLDFFGGSSESAEMQYMRKQFAIVNGRLERISLQLDNVYDLISWSTTLQSYSQHDQHISACGVKFDLYLNARSNEKKDRQDQFCDCYKTNLVAALSLYLGVMEERTITNNLANAALKFTHNHKPMVMSFLLKLTRDILRGAQMRVAYERIVRSKSSALILERDWKVRMMNLARRLKQVDDTAVRAWATQMPSDVVRVIGAEQSLSNRDFSGKMYNYLARKFYWRRWFVLIYKNVSGDRTHQVAVCNGAVHFRTHGARNVVVASADPGSSKFNRASSLSLLERIDKEVKMSYADRYVNAIKKHVGNSCADAAARIAVCWGCDVWYAAIASRVAYRKMSAWNGGHMNVAMFG